MKHAYHTQLKKRVLTFFHDASRSKGFTLVEMIIVLFLFLIVSFFLSYVAVYQYWVYNTGTVDVTIANDARIALDDIDNYVRQANRVLSSYLTYTTGPETLILRIQSVNSFHQLIAGAYDNVVFYVSGTDLVRKVFPDVSSSRLAATQILANNLSVSNAIFTYDNADYSFVTKVTTYVALQQNSGGKTRSITISSQSRLRNY